MEYGWELWGQRLAVGDEVRHGSPRAREVLGDRIGVVTEVTMRPDGEQLAKVAWGANPVPYPTPSALLLRVKPQAGRPEEFAGPVIEIGDEVWHEKRGAGRLKSIEGSTAMVHLSQRLWPEPLPLAELRPFTLPPPVTRVVDGKEMTARWGVGQQYRLRARRDVWVGPTADEVFRLYLGGRESKV
ncbi:hypothetical protein ACFVGM_09165 [Kitasatospora purpeofusca]|uniref:hypothetical protein n=1 Tax=Kitasatospora purpeofusca TaxID=67352 RepID=UPI0036AC3FDE